MLSAQPTSRRRKSSGGKAALRAVPSRKKLVCNLCGGKTFRDFRQQRKNAQCTTCRSLERHRAIYPHLEKLIEKKAVNLNGRGKLTFLHHAPEPQISALLSKAASIDYHPGDIDPARYKHVACEHFVIPDSFATHEIQGWDVIYHSHVFEHIPIPWRNLLDLWIRNLGENGTLIFTMPWAESRTVTMEGGEYVQDKELRVLLFGQDDHIKRFGTDIRTYVEKRGGHYKEMSDHITGQKQPLFVIGRDAWIFDGYL